MTAIAKGSTGERYWFLDWVRVGAFGLLILYHVGMYHWEGEAWHVKARHQTELLDYTQSLLYPWRLSLLFFIAGVASRFMLDRMGGGAFAGSRLSRLGIPLIFGMVVVCAPQAYVEGLYKGALEPGWWQFWGRYLGFDPTLEQHFTWNHLWFVVYLLVYSLILAALASPLARAAGALDRSGLFARPLPLVLLPALAVGAAYGALRSHFPSTHALVDDWTNHASYASMVLLGYLLARNQGFWAAAERVRWATAAIFFLVYLAFLGLDWIPAETRQDWRPAIRVVFKLQAWCAILAILGFARRHLNRPHPAVAYLNEAVFPYYIIHQTIIVVLGWWFLSQSFHPLAEWLALVALTAAGCALTFELARRSGPLRPLFGLKPEGARRMARA
jgi:hypothetical protein